jgi:hypothetical protein
LTEKMVQCATWLGCPASLVAWQVVCYENPGCA